MTPVIRALLVLPIVASAVAAQRAPARYVAPTSQTVFTETEMTAGAIPGQIVYVVNHSSVPVIIYSYVLRNCENVKESCVPRRASIKVRPAGREVVTRVHPKNEFETVRFSLSIGFRADSANMAAMQAIAGAGVASAQERVDATREANAVAQREPSDVLLDQPALVALGAQLATIKVEADSLVMREGRAFLLRDVKLMALDSAGNLLGRVVGGLRWGYEQNMVLMNRADTLMAAMPGRAVITFKLSPPLKPLETRLPIIVLPDSAPPLSARTASGRTSGPAAR